MPWRTAEAINKDAAEDEYLAVATLKLVTDIRKHVAGAKVELPTSLRGSSATTATYWKCFLAPIAPIWHMWCPSGMH